jgi:pimeloyl-ACP methyl ester carboxylesterase
MAKPRLGQWTNAEAERRFLELEGQLRAEAWPEAPEEIEVDTRFGRTLAYRWAGRGEPVVLLHGYGATSVMWGPVMKRLGDGAFVAFDTVGDAGRSVQTAPITKPQDLADWLVDALAALDLGRAHLVGASYGGWIALLTALHHTEHVASISLLEPLGLEKLNMVRFMSWGALCGLAAISPESRSGGAPLSACARAC